MKLKSYIYVVIDITKTILYEIASVDEGSRAEDCGGTGRIFHIIVLSNTINTIL